MSETRKFPASQPMQWRLGGSAPRTNTVRGQSFGRFEVVAACLSAPATADSHEIERGKWRTIRTIGRRSAGNSWLARRARAWAVRIRIRRERHRFRRSARSFGCGSLSHRKRLLAAIEARSGASRQGMVEKVVAPQGERREVTILFADLSGFTALSRSLDAEQVHELVTRFTSLVDSVIVGYDGSIDKHIGDAVMALFAAPRAHDDNSFRATWLPSISMKPWLDRTRIPLTLFKRISESRHRPSSTKAVRRAEA